MTKIYEKDCEICAETFKSLSESQLDYNFKQHHQACLKKAKRRENAKPGRPKGSKTKEFKNESEAS